MRIFSLIIALFVFATIADAAPRGRGRSAVVVAGRGRAAIVVGNRGRAAIVVGNRNRAAIVIGNRGIRRVGIVVGNRRQNFIFRRQNFSYGRQNFVVGGGYGTQQIVTGGYSTQQIVTVPAMTAAEEVADPTPVVVQRVIVQRVVTPSYGCSGTSAVRFLRYGR